MDKKFTIELSHWFREQLLEIIKWLKNFNIIWKNKIKLNRKSWKENKSLNNFDKHIEPIEIKVLIRQIQRKIWLINLRFYFSKNDILFANNWFLITNKPYVIYIEKATAIFGYFTNNYNKFLTKVLLLNRLKDPNLKKIIFRTKTAMIWFINTYEKDPLIQKYIIEKSTYSYPPDNNTFNNSLNRFKNPDIIKLLFVSWSFIMKWWYQLVKVFNKITQNSSKQIELTIITKIDTIDTESLKIIQKNSNIKLINANYSPEELFKQFYNTHHIFVYPTFSDSFSMVINEAISWFLPIITSNFFSIPERVFEWINWYMFESPYKNYNLNFTIYQEHFSERNDILKTIYTDSINNKLQYVEDFLYEKLILLINNNDLLIKLAEWSQKIYNEILDKNKIKNKINEIFLSALKN